MQQIGFSFIVNYNKMCGFKVYQAFQMVMTLNYWFSRSCKSFHALLSRVND